MITISHKLLDRYIVEKKIGERRKMEIREEAWVKKFFIGLGMILLMLLTYGPHLVLAESKDMDGLKIDLLVENPIEEETSQAYINEKLDIGIKIFWNDNGNLAESRPDKFLVKLLANGKDTGKYLELAESENWEGSFRDLEMEEGVNYTLSTGEAEGYKIRIYGDPSEGFEIVNNLLSQEEVSDLSEGEEELIVPEEIIIEPKKSLVIDRAEAKTNEEIAPIPVEGQDQPEEEPETQEAEESEKEEIQEESKPEVQDEIKDETEEKEDASPELEDQAEVLEKEEKNSSFPSNILVILGLILLIIVLIRKKLAK